MTIPRNILATVSAFAPFALGSGGCVVTPHDDQPLSSTSEAVPFGGYHPSTDATMRVQGKLPGTNTFESFGPTASPDSSVPIPTDGSTVYPWSISALRVPSRFWFNDGDRAKVNGSWGRGKTAQVRVFDQQNGVHLMSVKHDWIDCFNEVGGDVLAFAEQCGGDDSPLISLHDSRFFPVFDGKGNAECEFGDPGCNTCVTNVEGQFPDLGRHPDGNRKPTARIKLLANDNRLLGPAPNDFFEELDKDNGRGHIQGMGRLSTGDNRWLVFSTSSSSAHDAGFIAAHLGDIAGNGGERFVLAGQDRDKFNTNDPPWQRRVRAFYPVGGQDADPALTSTHGGGLQVLGDLVFVAYRDRDARKGRVDIWNLSDPLHGWLVQTVTLPAWDGSVNSALYVAATRTASGHYVMAVNRTNSGKMSILVSNGPTLSSTTKWGLTEEPNWGGNEGWYDGSCVGDDMAYQGANFVTECGSGNLYLLAMRQNCVGWNADNSVHLFRVRGQSDGDFAVSKVDAVHPDGSDSDWCELRGGSGIYVTPSHEMILYCSKGVRTSGSCSGCLKVAEQTVN